MRARIGGGGAVSAPLSRSLFPSLPSSQYPPHAFFFSSRRPHTRSTRDWSSDVCSSDLGVEAPTVGELIAYHRRRRGLSQARFAKLLDRSVSWVSQVERGIKPVDRLPVLREVARVLEVPPAELLPESMLPEAAEREHPAAKAIRLTLSGHPSLAAELKAGTAGPAPSIDLDDLEARTGRAWELAHASRFLEMGELVAELVPELEAAARQLKGEPKHTAFRLLADSYQ